MDSTSAAAFLAVLGSMMVFIVIFYVLLIVAWWKIFDKAGEAGWKSIIPIYNGYTLYKICWKTEMFWITLGLAVVGSIMQSMGVSDAGDPTIVGLIGSLAVLAACVMGFIASYRLCKSFGKGVGFFILSLIIPNIMWLILGFGSAQYQGNDAK